MLYVHEPWVYFNTRFLMPSPSHPLPHYHSPGAAISWWHLGFPITWTSYGIVIPWDCGDNEDRLNKKSKGYSKLDIVRESATIICIGQRLRGGQGWGEKWESFVVEKKGRLRSALIGGYWCGEAVNGLTKAGHPMWLIRGVHICLSPVGPNIEAGTKIREAVSYWSNLGHLGLIVIGVIV